MVIKKTHLGTIVQVVNTRKRFLWYVRAVGSNKVFPIGKSKLYDVTEIEKAKAEDYFKENPGLY